MYLSVWDTLHAAVCNVVPEVMLPLWRHSRLDGGVSMLHIPAVSAQFCTITCIAHAYSFSRLPCMVLQLMCTACLGSCENVS